MKENQSSGRIETFDIAKGLGIILVYLGHVPPTAEIKCMIYAFHMPLFFFLSGIFLNEKKREPLNFVLYKSKTLLVPLVTFVLFSIIVGWISDGKIEKLHTSLTSTLWFLPVLYFSEILCYFLCRFFESKKKLFVALLILTLFGFLIDFNNILAPFALSTIPIASSFMLLGKMSCSHLFSFLKDPLSNRSELIKKFVCCFLILLLFVLLGNQSTNLHKAHLAYGPLGWIASIVGIIMTVLLTKVIDSILMFRKFFIICGQNSLLIFGLHLTIIQAVGLTGGLCIYQPLHYLFLNIFVILALVILIKIINRWLLWSIGKF